MVFDLVVVGLFVMFIFGGWRKGFLYQLVRVAILIGAWFAARAFYPAVTPVVAKVSDMPQEFHGLLAFVALFLGLFLLGTILAGTFLARWHEHHPVAGTRLAGGALGGAKFAVLAYAAICFGLALGPAFGRTFDEKTQESRVLRWVNAHNALYEEAGVYLRGVAHLGDVLKDPDRTAKLAEDPEIRAFLRGPDGDTLRSADVKIAVQQGNWTGLLADERVRKLISNPQFYRALERIAQEDAARAGDDHYTNKAPR
jgi:uncharacterized membrane protein required for colicin V production